MASSGSLKDLIKASTSYLSSTSPTLPLPDELSQAIEAFSSKNEKFDESISEKLHEELQSIYHKHVVGASGKKAVFIAILRRLLPILRVPSRIFYWWDQLQDVTNANVSPDKGVLDESSVGMLDMLLLDDEDEQESSSGPHVNAFAERLYTQWMEKHRALEADDSPNNVSFERALRETLIAWGKKRPKSFLTVLDRFFIKCQYRPRTLRILSDFIQSQPPHLHLILQTPLFRNILRCLQQDTSTVVVSLALTTLIMALPHLPSALVPHLPSLFNVYARLLFWENERTGTIEAAADDLEHKTHASTPGWETCSFSPETDGLDIPHLANYFTILYGLYPINLTDYIRKPQRYLRHANAANQDELDVQPTEIRHKSEKFRRSHLLHPNFYTLTIDSEKTDMGRWLNCEPAELVADCIALRIHNPSGIEDSSHIPPIPGASTILSSEGSDREGLEAALLSGSGPEPVFDSWRNSRGSGADSPASSRVHSLVQRRASQSSRPSIRDFDMRSREVGGGADSPNLGPQLTVSSSQTQLQDMLQSNKAIKSGLNQSLANDSVPSLALSHVESVQERPASRVPTPGPVAPSVTSPGGLGPRVAQLQQHVLLLQNDLSFERYLKQQHMAHIGELRRKQVREAASEAETQNLIMLNRNLKNRLEDSKKAEMQIRKESEKSRTLAKKWESDFSTKLRALREESRKTKAEEEALRRELQSAKQESERLRKIVCDAEVKELNSRQNMQSVEMDKQEMGRLRAEVDRLTLSERDFQAKEEDRQVALRSATEAESRSKALDMRLDAREKELQKTRTLFQSQLANLNAKLVEAQEGPRRRPAEESRAMLEGALAASRAKQEELQKEHENLVRKYTMLQMQFEDIKMAGGSSLGHARNEPTFRMDSEGESTHSTSPVNVRMRPQRVASEQDLLDPSSYIMSPQLDSKPGTPVPMSTSPGGPVEGLGLGVSTSPDLRFHGRGGVQNKIRREDKGKQKDDGEAEKKEKRSPGLRGIRGFV